MAQDGDFSEQRFRDIVNAFLANSVGNLLNRTLGLLRKNCAGTLPAAAASVPADNPLRAVAELEVCPLDLHPSTHSHPDSAQRPGSWHSLTWHTLPMFILILVKSRDTELFLRLQRLRFTEQVRD